MLFEDQCRLRTIITRWLCLAGPMMTNHMNCSSLCSDVVGHRLSGCSNYIFIIDLTPGFSGGEFTGHRWIPHTKASDAELWCFSLICAWINGWVNNRHASVCVIHFSVLFQQNQDRCHYKYYFIYHLQSVIKDAMFPSKRRLCAIHTL